ncbi:MAG TPA: LuxR C-terminal-related transcriptional regulator [Gaiellaceae bacterium]|nr:LuxR C-terminal-related transcriptional regulator [Gaiellaceae bacterium]
MLDANTAQTILVTAPAGYGKTTLAAEWVQGRDDVVWYRATSGSADVAAFSAGIADVMAPLVPGVGDRLKQRLRVADTPERLARPLAEILSEDLESWPADALLIIDDYHLVVDSAPVEEFMDWLLTLTPALQVLVTARRRPKWASARRILYGEITEIDRGQLAMTTEEAALVLDGRSTEEVQALVQHAEGWPALIGLAALSATHELPTERVSEALYRYFAEEVVRGVTQAEADFILRASVPARLDERIGRAVLKIEDSPELIKGLVAEGLLQPAGSSHLEFHPLLRSFLRQRLRTEEPEAWRQLCEASISDSREHSNWEDAFEIAAYSGDFAAATEIVEEAAPMLLADGRVETLERWLEECGETGGEHPGALLVRAELLTRQGELGQAATLAESVATALPPDHRLASRANHIAGQAHYLRSRSDLAASFYSNALEAARSEPDRKNALWGAFLAQVDLDIESSTAFLAELESAAAEDLSTRLRVTIAHQTVALAQGSLTGVWSAARALVPLARHTTDPLVRSNFLAQSSYVACARSDYEAALELVDEALDLSLTLHHDFATGCCLAYRAAAKIGMRRLVSAGADLSDLMQMTVYREDPYLQTQRALTDARLSIAQRDLALARAKLEEPSRGNPSAATHGERIALLALVLSAAGESQQALRHADEARSITASTEAHFLCEFSEVIAAFDSGVDTRRVHDVVVDAFAADYTDSFVVAYRAFPRLLGAMKTDRQLAQLVSPVLESARDIKIAQRAGVKLQRPQSRRARSEPLTKREEEVLELLALGLSNAEIGQRLFIAQSTVKVHVRHILEKLGARNRVQAALFAKRDA